MIGGGQIGSSAREYKERYIVKFNDRIVPLNVTDIAYIYSEEKNNYLVTNDGQKYIIDSSLDVMNEELNPDAFFKISRSCIVSMKSIKSIIKQPGGRLRIMTQPGSHFEMTVSRSRVDDFIIWLEK
jgi:DNA-binding LytR/AlgR family response regulator